jgi:hypothetical protein
MKEGAHVSEMCPSEPAQAAQMANDRRAQTNVTFLNVQGSGVANELRVEMNHKN